MKEIMKKYYLVGIAIILVIIYIFMTYRNEEEVLVFNPSTDMEVTEETKYIYVDIKGYVMNPGVYKVEEYSRLFQVIALAGGITSDADALAFNLSLKLRDEQVIYIPAIGEEYPRITEIIENEENGIININTANSLLLETLPGIGPATAKSIIDYREENGDFSSIDNLIEVPGIGEATMNEIREYITT